MARTLLCFNKIEVGVMLPSSIHFPAKGQRVILTSPYQQTHVWLSMAKRNKKGEVDTEAAKEN